MKALVVFDLDGTLAPSKSAIDAEMATLLTALLRAGIAFLSGGQSGELGSARLNAMNVESKLPPSRFPWPLAFSFARAIQQPALDIWHGRETNRLAAQRALHHRACCNKAALSGDYDAAMERERPSLAIA